MRFNLAPILLVVLIFFPPLGEAARPLGSPIAEFFKIENRVACGVVLEKLTTNRISIQVDRYLYQDDDATITLGVDPEIFTNVEVGKEYVFVFSRLRKNPLTRDAWEVNPEGPRLVKVRGLGTSAIYPYDAAILTLLTPPDGRDELTADTETSLLLQTAEHKNDSAARELAIFELFLRSDLQRAISGDNADRYAKLAISADPRLKNYLLQGAGNFPEELRKPWLLREYRDVIAGYGIELELNSDVPLLVKNSLLGLREDGTVDDLDIAGKHLYSNAPGVARAALAALDAIDPQQALDRAQQALQADTIHLVTRRVLTTYISEQTQAQK